MCLCFPWYKSMTWEKPGQLQGLKTPNPEIPRTQKKTKKIPWAPSWQPPNSLKDAQEMLRIPEKLYFSGILSVLGSFLRNLGSGPKGSFFSSFFSRNFGVRVLSPCSWPGVSQSMTYNYIKNCLRICWCQATITTTWITIVHTNTTDREKCW